MTDKDLILKIQALRQIKPRENWVIFAKSRVLDNVILTEKTAAESARKPLLSNVFELLFRQRAVAVSLAALLLVLGVSGFVYNNEPKSKVALTNASPAALSEIKSNVETFKAKSQDLANAVKNNSGNVPLAVKEVKNAEEQLTNSINKDPQLAKTVALEVNNNKTYLDIAEDGDLKETSDVLYKTIDNQMIEDLQKAELTQDQQNALNVVKDLYDKGRYSAALENILLINSAVEIENRK